jgi:MscS family membrane protein
MNKFFIKTVLLLLLPLYLYSQTSLNSSPSSKLNEVQINDDSRSIAISEIDKQLAIQKQLIDDVVSNINNETYIVNNKDEKYSQEIRHLFNKIHINKKENNTLAVKRDELNLELTRMKKSFETTLRAIIKAKQGFKDKEYFIERINRNIKEIEKIDLNKYSNTYEKELNQKHTLAKEFINSYLELQNQKNSTLFILNYLIENVQDFRKTNFFIDKFNLQYFVSQIDELKGVSFISEFTAYHLKFSVGEIIVVMFIILFFRLLNTKIIALIAGFFSKIFFRKIDETNEEQNELTDKYLKRSIDTPLIYSLYALSIHISMYILIKDPALIQQVLPWINTIYMALLTWALYALLNNGIDIYAHNLLEKYPNVRKEMIIFVLRIIKIILVLFVVLFLFTQLGIDIKAIAASLGVGGIAIALASKDTLANFFGSLNIMTDNSFSQGDWIRSDNIEGTVVDIRMRTTRIRTFDNAMITIPNSQLANTHIMNWSKRRIGRRIKMNIGITYQSKMEDIVQLKHDLLEMLENHPEIATGQDTKSAKRKKFEAIKKDDLQGIKRTLLVYIDKFNDSSVDILIYCFSKSPVWSDWLSTKEKVIIEIDKLVKKNNCDFAYPTQTIILDKEEKEEI